MSRRVAIVLAVALFVAIGFGLIIPAIQKSRLKANMLASQNNLREVSLFAAHHAQSDAQDPGRLLHRIPAGTVVLPGVLPEDRLSWVVPVLPGLNQKRQDLAGLVGELDDAQPWKAERNQTAGKTALAVLLCPERTPQVPPDSPGVTCYVGIAGLGTDAANIALPDAGPIPPRAGAFRYNAPTPFSRIEDGLSQTLLFAETANEVGPWLRGGNSTVRGFDDATGAKPLLGVGGQFGGYFPNGANMALCDGSVRFFTTSTTPDVLLRMATIAGGVDAGIVGE